MTTIQVGNSVQQQAAPGIDSEIQQHTIQEKPYYEKDDFNLPELNVYVNMENFDKTAEKLYSILTEINEKYRLSDEALEALDQGGIKAMMEEIKQEGDKWNSEDHMPWWYLGPFALIGNVIDKAVNDGYTKSQKRTGTEIGLDTLENIINTAIQSFVIGPQASLIWGGVIEGINVLKKGLSQPSIEQGQKYIDLWYDSLMNKLHKSYFKGNFNIYLQ